MLHTSLFALLCATATGIVIANLWYSPFLFGKLWRQESKKYIKDPEATRKKSRQMYDLFYVYLLFVAIVLGELIFLALQFYGGDKVLVGAITGFCLWFGIATPILFLNYLGLGMPFKLFLLNTAYQMVSLTITGAVLGLLFIERL